MGMVSQRVYAVMFDRDGFQGLARNTGSRVPDARYTGDVNQFPMHVQRSANKPLPRQRNCPVAVAPRYEGFRRQRRVTMSAVQMAAGCDLCSRATGALGVVTEPGGAGAASERSCETKRARATLAGNCRILLRAAGTESKGVGKERS